MYNKVKTYFLLIYVTTVQGFQLLSNTMLSKSGGLLFLRVGDTRYFETLVTIDVCGVYPYM